MCYLPNTVLSSHAYQPVLPSSESIIGSLYAFPLHSVVPSSSRFVRVRSLLYRPLFNRFARPSSPSFTRRVLCFQGIAAGLYSFSTPVPDFCQLVALECHVKSDVLRRHLAEVVEKLRRKQQVTDAVRARARQVFDPDSPENHRVRFEWKSERLSLRSVTLTY